MSHIPERKEKDCLNCGAIVQGRYCQNCGQENVVPHETFWHMAKHFLYDITHFDSKFFDSMKFLLLKPGFLPTEYVRGRRASYLNPVKKYVFTSAIFFLLFFGFFIKTDSVKVNMDVPITSQERKDLIKEGEEEIAKNPGNTKWSEALALLRDTTKALTKEDLVGYVWENFDYINLGERSYRSLYEYDSVQKALPENERDGCFQRLLQKRNLKLKEKYGNDPRKGTTRLVDAFMHKLPYILFVSLPLFALILKLLYIRRKEFYYADHGVFSIYHYIFTFLTLLVVFVLDKAEGITHFKPLTFLAIITFFMPGVYLYLSMKRFYKQGHGKTIIKFIILNIAGVVTLTLLFMIFILFAVFEI